MAKKTVAPMADGEVVKGLGKRLAHADKATRDEGFKALKAYLRQSADAPESDTVLRSKFMKIWKALFYCFWMCDKIPVQLELSHRMGQLVNTLTARSAFVFWECYQLTFAREWEGVDKWRVNKFYKLMRDMQQGMFVFLGRRQWALEYILKYNRVMATYGPVCPIQTPKGLIKPYPLSLRVLYLDMLIPQLREAMNLLQVYALQQAGKPSHATAEALDTAQRAALACTTEAFMTLLTPVVDFIVVFNNPVMTKHAKENFYNDLIEAAKEQVEMAAAGEIDPALPAGDRWALPISEIRDLLFARGSATHASLNVGEVYPLPTGELGTLKQGDAARKELELLIPRTPLSNAHRTLLYAGYTALNPLADKPLTRPVVYVKTEETPRTVRKRQSPAALRRKERRDALLAAQRQRQPSSASASADDAVAGTAAAAAEADAAAAPTDAETEPSPEFLTPTTSPTKPIFPLTASSSSSSSSSSSAAATSASRSKRKAPASEPSPLDAAEFVDAPPLEADTMDADFAVLDGAAADADAAKKAASRIGTPLAMVKRAIKKARKNPKRSKGFEVTETPEEAAAAATTSAPDVAAAVATAAVATKTTTTETTTTVSPSTPTSSTTTTMTTETETRVKRNVMWGHNKSRAFHKTDAIVPAGKPVPSKTSHVIKALKGVLKRNT